MNEKRYSLLTLLVTFKLLFSAPGFLALLK